MEQRAPTPLAIPLATPVATNSTADASTTVRPLSKAAARGLSFSRLPEVGPLASDPYVRPTRVASHALPPSPSRRRAALRFASLGSIDEYHPFPSPPLRPPADASIRALRPASAMSENMEITADVGDIVEVPGGMTGTVKFVGNVMGKKGVFAGVELSREFASRGKNDGDADGQRYFNTTIPGSGIFLPAHRAVRLSSPTASADTQPSTPTTPGLAGFDYRNARASSQSPQTPATSRFTPAARNGQRPNFSQSVGPGARAPSPQQKALKPRQSLPRPESPLRKQPSMPNTQTPGRLSGGGGFGLGQPAKGSRPSVTSPGPKPGFGLPKTPAANRSPSRSQSRTQERDVDVDNTPITHPRASTANGAGRSRPPSRAQSTAAYVDPAAESEELARLKSNLQERDRQLKEQALSLAEMESSLAELQTMVADHTRQPLISAPNGEDVSLDVAQLRIMVRDKNDKIASLTAEFDNHRADFRSTIDTLEMASTETERVYEQRVQELIREVQELQDRHSDVDGFARELKRLEEFVQELEEGLEDARRGEAEARAEVEFLRGEVDRGRTELRREREKAAKALKGATGAVNEAAGDRSSANGDRSREMAMAARDDEIRGLKAIIHSLSSSGPDGSNASPSTSNRNTVMSTTSSTASDHAAEREQLTRLRAAMDQLNREKSELRGLIERKNFREEELERELAELRSGPDAGTAGDDSNTTPRKHSDSAASAKTAIRPGTAHRDPQPPPPPAPLDTSNFGNNDKLGLPHFASPPDGAAAAGALGTGRSGFGSRSPSSAHSPVGAFHERGDSAAVAPLSIGAGARSSGAPSPGGAVPKPSNDANASSSSNNNDGGIMAQLTGEGPVAGKASGRIDMSKWCALCERDGHDSVDCPLEDEF